MKYRLSRAILALLALLASVTTIFAGARPGRSLSTSSIELRSIINKMRFIDNQEQDGPVSIKYGALFKEGSVEYDPVDIRALTQLPPLPTGYTIFNNLAYRVVTKAVVSGPNAVVFRISSANNQTDFNHLRILHLEYDELSSTKSSWADRTVLSDNRHEAALEISRDALNELQPNFAAKTLAAQVSQLGLFVIALYNDQSPVPERPFTEMGVFTTSSPDPVKAGGKLTYTITVKNKGFKTAEDVNLSSEMDPDMDVQSVSSSQGSCRNSEQSDGRVLCNLEIMSPGQSATIRIVVKIRRKGAWAYDERTRKALNLTTVIFKEHKADMPSYQNAVSREQLTTVLTRP